MTDDTPKVSVQQTKEGYFILDISNLSPGLYAVEGYSGSYVVNIIQILCFLKGQILTVHDDSINLTSDTPYSVVIQQDYLFPDCPFEHENIHFPIRSIDELQDAIKNIKPKCS